MGCPPRYVRDGGGGEGGVGTWCVHACDCVALLRSASNVLAGFGHPLRPASASVHTSARPEQPKPTLHNISQPPSFPT